MDALAFVKLVTEGDEVVALAELEREPALASARGALDVSVVCWAMYYRRPRLARALAERRADLDIFEASCIGDAASVRRIVSEAPAGVNAISPDGFTPLGYSAFFGHAELLGELLALGAEVNLPSRNAMAVYPINSAAAHADAGQAVALVAALLDAGANANARQHGGFTALHEAAFNGKSQLIRLLLERGADPALQNDAGASALDLARSNGHAEAVQILSAHSESDSKTNP